MKILVINFKKLFSIERLKGISVKNELDFS